MGKTQEVGAEPSRRYPKEIAEAEQARVKTRRLNVNNEAKSEQHKIKPDSPMVGFALSGGGIRSATFCLGVFQALAQKKLLRRIDFLSTVSGGGYLGGFLGRLCARDYATPERVEQLLDPTQGPLHWADPSKPDAKAARIDPVHWLRLNGRYMAPNGGGDLLTAVAVAIRNALALHAVVAIALLMFLLVLQALLMAVAQWPWFQGVTAKLPSLGAWMVDHDSLLVPGPLVDLLPFLMIFYLLPLGWSYWVIERGEPGRIHPRWGLFVVLGLACVAGLINICGVPGWLRGGWLSLFEALTALRASAAYTPMVTSVLAISLLAVVALLYAFKIAADRVEAEFPAAPVGAGGDDREAVVAGLAGIRAWWADAHAPTPQVLFRLAQQRSIVTNWLASGLVLTGVVILLALVDSIGLTLYIQSYEADGLPMGWFSAVVAALAPIALRLGSLQGLLNKLNKSGSSFRLPVQALVGLAGFAAWGIVLIGMSWLARAIRHGFADPIPTGTLALPLLWWPLLTMLGLLALFSWLFGRTWTFLNRSSHAALYAARLTRAYLGASNPRRFYPGQQSSVTEPLPDDDDNHPSYHAKMLANGGPLHLINVTLNDTVSDRGRTVLRDRKGLGLAIGPCALSAGAQDHALHAAAPVESEAVAPRLRKPPRPPAVASSWHARCDPLPRTSPAGNDDEDSLFANTLPEARGQAITPERLSMGQWIAISGAAFSTGLGSQTSLGMSLLFGFANVRLGYWWDSGRKLKPRNGLRGILRWLLPVQAHLANEFFARFHGAEEPRWYLSDGGHFENMGAYELIRRRLPMIVVIDAEADPDYGYEGFANLVRKARMDFGADIRVLEPSALDTLLHPKIRRLFGTLDQMRPRGDDKFSGARAALADIRYDGEAQPQSLLIYLKATLAADDPVDVREYRTQNPAFPQQTTADQFFDEAQWESYRKLGEIIASAVFAEEPMPARDQRFLPAALWPSFIRDRAPKDAIVRVPEAQRWQPGQ